MGLIDFQFFVKNRLANLVSFSNSGTDLASTNLQDSTVELANRHFGKNAGLKEKTASETTTGTTFAVYDSLDFVVSNTGGANKFRLAVMCLYGHNSASNDIRFRLNLDNGSKIVEGQVEPKDPGADQRIPGWIVFEANDLADGPHTLALEYRPETASRVSRMFFSLLEAWRIS